MSAQVIKEDTSYSASFRALQERRKDSLATWIKRLRESAFDRFEQLGYPTTRDEEWKYTNVAPLSKIAFAIDTNGTPRETQENFAPSALNEFICPEARQSLLVFVNGIFQAKLSSLEGLPANFIAQSFSEALEDEAHAKFLRERLGLIIDYNENAFTALNTAFLGSGAFIRIPKNVRLDAPLQLLFIADPQAADAPPVSFPRILIVAEEASASTIIESYASLSEGVYFTNAVVEIFLEDGARLEHCKVQRESAQSFHVATTAAALNRNSNYDATTITLGAQLSRHDIKVNLDAEGSECAVDGLYLVTTGQHTDTHSLIDHRQPHCTSHQLYKGILDGKSRAVFNGKIFVREGAQQTNAFQTNRNLLLSNEARIDTKPQLEIFADDVKCSHGATVGQLEEEELFYLLSRGLSPDLARNLLTYGFAEQVINKIKIESIRAQLDEAVLHRLHARLEKLEETVQL